MKYDVVIVGAGPAGLKAAEVLAKNKKKVLVLEKNKSIGPKVCAGGITEGDLKYIPKKLMEREFDSFFIVSKNKTRIKYKCYTLERKKLGQYQLKKAKKAGAIIKTNSFVKKIKRNSVIANDKEYFFDYLIGADGSNSAVRKYLGIKSEIIGLAVQYKLNKTASDLEVHYNPKKYRFWCSWVFPHKNYTYIGTGAALIFKETKHIRKTLDNFAKQYNFNIKNAKFEAALINADYKGFKFKNIFLVGDAAGLANLFTGEGIYQALVSGEEIAKKIINPKYEPKKLRRIIEKNKKLTKLFFTLHHIPWLMHLCYWLGFKLIGNKKFQRRLVAKFLEY